MIIFVFICVSVCVCVCVCVCAYVCACLPACLSVTACLAVDKWQGFSFHCNLIALIKDRAIIYVICLFSTQLAELPTDSTDNPWEMSAEEVERRRDIRQSHLVFSIDPKGCEDVDDTLSLR